MAGGDDAPKGTADKARRRAVKPPTIDLKATELNQPEAAKDEPGAKAAEAPAASQPEEGIDGGASTPEGSLGSPPADRAEDEEREPDAPSAAAEGEDDASAVTRPRSSAALLLAAGLAGGVVALALYVALQFSGVLPGSGERDEAMAAQLAEASQEVDALQARLASLEEAEPAAAPDADLAERLDALAGRLAEIEQAAPAAGFDQGLVERLDALEAGLADAASAQAADLSLAAVEAAQAEALPAEAAGEIEQRLSALEDAVGEQRAAFDAFREEVGRQVSGMQSTVRETDIAADRAIARAGAGAVALSSLMRAVDTGQPFQRELETLTPLLEEGGTLEILPAHAEVGLPTAQRLAAEFDRRVGAILSAGEDSAEGDGVVARLAAGARSLVRIRPAGPVPGTSREAIVSRIEDALARGDLQAAHQEWQSLDETARAAAAEWGEALRNRVAAETEIAEIAAATSAAVGSAAPAN